MKKVVLFAALLFTLVLSLQSCKTTAPCPAYPNETLNNTQSTEVKA